MTKDGSHTAIHPQYHAHYHSEHGALTESCHVFIQEGLNHFLSLNTTNTVAVFEMGFGTGLNAFLAYAFCSQHGVSLTYHGIEKYPLDAQSVNRLNYTKLLDMSEEQTSLFHLLHTDRHFQQSAREGQINANMNLTICDLMEFENSETFDLVFFDAFGPGTQPEMWSESVMVKMYGLLRSGGILSTFCAQGQFRRNLRSAGFDVEKIPGPPGKREMTRATKP